MVFCKDTEIVFNLELWTDAKPFETSWELIDVLNTNEGVDPVVLEGKDYYRGYSMYNVESCIPRNACYNFIIYDSASDGICCFNGYGHYKVDIQENNGTFLTSSGIENFLSGDKSSFRFYGGNNNIVCPTPSPTQSPAPTTLAPTGTPYEYQRIDGLRVILPIVGFLIFIGLVFLCAVFCCKNLDRNSLSNINNNNSQEPGLTAEEERQQNRRLKILTSIIHKKVLSRRKVTSDDHDDKDLGHELILPHEKPLSSRRIVQEEEGSIFTTPNKESFSDNAVSQQTLFNYRPSSLVPIPFSPASNDDVNDDSKRRDSNDNDSNGDAVKDDIYMEIYRQQSQSSFVSTRSSIYSPKSCPICLEEYKVGDQIAWSKNNECPHAFHLDCMINWLMAHDECPLCRADYL